MSIVNVRDLGAYSTRDGRKVKKNLLIRAAHLADASDQELDSLSRLPVTKVVDFRHDSEKVEWADRTYGRRDPNAPGAVSGIKEKR